MKTTSDSCALDLTAHRHIHFVGVGGIGMSALAGLLLARGFTISGSDRADGEQIATLRTAGAVIHVGHNSANVDGADLVVTTPAVRGDNAEVQAALALGIQVVKRADVLGVIANASQCIAVAGTHGKTTTSSLIGFILSEDGRDPTALLGGVSKDFGSNVRIGASDLVVMEADEYDATFLGLRPQIGVITNVAAEHLDFFGTEANVFGAFRTFAEGVRDILVICSDDPVLPELVEGVSARIVTYGLSGGDWHVTHVQETGGRMRFIATHDNRSQRISTSLAGIHNAKNILAAAAVCAEVGVSEECIVQSIGRFSGVGRRFDVKGESSDILVIDDYAVHPAEVRATLAAIRSRYGRPIRVVFQPHTYSRTRDFFDDFAGSFGDADAVYVMNIYAAREVDTLGVSGHSLATAIGGRHRRAVATGDREETLAVVCDEATTGDVIVTMGAGDVTYLGSVILERVSAR